MTIIDITKADEIVRGPDINGSVLFFWASWHEESSSPRGSIYTIFQTLAESMSSLGVGFYRVEAESVRSLTEAYNVQVIPTFVLLGRDGDVFDRVDGGDDIPRLTKAVAALGNSSTASASQTKPVEVKEEMSLNSRLKSLIESSPVMLFMKGEPNAPRCGFSRQTVELLSKEEIAFGTFDILSDEDVRQGLKTYSDWPTYPQLYVHGELIGGLDIIKEMANEGDLAGQLGVEKTKTATLEERLKKLITKHNVMLFMKGLPSAPKCGFSRQIVEILDKHNVEYDSFNILEDEEVRQGLKEYSDWPTYPQLYVTGDLVGGLDIVREMEENGELADLLKESV